MRLKCGICKGIAFTSLHIASDKAVEEILLKFGQHIQIKHRDVVAQLAITQNRLVGLVGSILLADQLEPDASDKDNERFSLAIEKGVDALLDALGVDTENISENGNGESSETAANETDVEIAPTTTIVQAEMEK